MSRKEEKMNLKPNAIGKLVFMLVSIAIMLFSVTQVYYLLRYTLGMEVSKKDLAVYNWVIKLVNYTENDEVNEQYAHETTE